MIRPLPISDFRWLNETEIENFRVSDISEEAEYGESFEVDFEYP